METRFYHKQGRSRGGFLGSQHRPLGTVAESLGTEVGPPALRQDGISALQLPGTPAAVPSAESHLLIAPPRCLQQRTDYSDGGEIEYGPLLAVTTQSNLSCAADCLHLASACKRACRWRRVQEKAGGGGTLPT